MKEIYTSDFISLNKVKTLSGSSAAVLISTNLIVSFLPADNECTAWTYSKWIGIALSLLIAFYIFMRSKEKKSEIILLTFINGFLIYSTAVGINTVSNGSKSTGKDSLRECANIGQFIIGKPWWEPSELVDTIRKQIVVINELKMGINDKHPKSNADSLNKIITDLKNSLKLCNDENKKKDDTIKTLKKQIAGFGNDDQIKKELKECNNEKRTLESQNIKLKSENGKIDSLLRECNKKLPKKVPK